jgi:uncharacterized membrane protein
MYKSVLNAVVTTTATIGLLSAATAGTLIPVPSVPGSAATVIRGINDNNVITGSVTDPRGTVYGFVGTLDGNYTYFDFPNGYTIPAAISDNGTITGHSESLTSDCPYIGCEYLRKPDGSIAPITKDGAPLDGVAQGIIAKTKFVGEYFVFTGVLNSYGYYGKGTQYRTALTLPFNAPRTSPRGYNTKGTVTGSFFDGDHPGLRPGFVLKKGTATAVNYPDEDASYTYLESVNDSGLIAGYWSSQDGNAGQPFLFNFAKNAFSPISIPGAQVASAYAINNNGVVAVTDFTVSYIFCLKKKDCPASPNAIEIPDRWIPARTRSAVCRNGCAGPLHIRASRGKIDVAAIREAIGHDPEFGPLGRR